MRIVLDDGILLPDTPASFGGDYNDAPIDGNSLYYAAFKLHEVFSGYSYLLAGTSLPLAYIDAGTDKGLAPVYNDSIAEGVSSAKIVLWLGNPGESWSEYYMSDVNYVGEPVWYDMSDTDALPNGEYILPISNTMYLVMSLVWSNYEIKSAVVDPESYTVTSYEETPYAVSRAAKYETLKDLFAAIAESIKRKTNNNVAIPAIDFPDAIDEIPVGGDFSEATLDSGEKMLSGVKAYGVDGTLYEGSITSRGVSDITFSNGSVNVPEGHYKNGCEKQIPTVQVATPAISVSNDGTVVATVNQQTGYVTGGETTTTYTLSDSDDSDFIASNIKYGAKIFGITGTRAPVVETSPDVDFYDDETARIRTNDSIETLYGYALNVKGTWSGYSGTVSIIGTPESTLINVTKEDGTGGTIQYDSYIGTPTVKNSYVEVDTAYDLSASAEVLSAIIIYDTAE